MQEKLKTAIQGALGKLGIPAVEFAIEHPKELSHGDWATNVALVVGKQVGTSPLEMAQKIVDLLGSIDTVEKVEIAGPGFINFTLTRDTFVAGLAEATKEGWGNTQLYTGKKILVEHSSPNLFKPFHIGHLMNNTVGEAFTRLACVSGAQTNATSFPSDVSLGIGKAIFILLEKYGADYEPNDIATLGAAYVEGTKRYEEDESIQARVKEITDNLYAQTPSPEWSLFARCKALNIAYFEGVVAKLGSHFDSYIYESESGVEGKKIVLENTPTVFIESDGAIVYIPQEGRKDINTAVFINSQGNPTYEAKDMGLLALKFERYNPDISVYVTDHQQIEHFKVVFAAMHHIKPDWVTKSVHRYHGRMTFKGQKMASRLGGVPIVVDVLTTVVSEVKNKNPDIAQEAAEIIGIAALKFAILKAQAGKNIDFDPDTALSFEGDSGPYLQYTAVRAGTLLQKGADAEITPDTNTSVVGTETLERYIARFPEIVARAQTEWAPHYLATYLIELAQYFNSWYGQGKIIDEDKDATAYRLAVVAAVRNTLIRGLWILGIEVPERM